MPVTTNTTQKAKLKIFLDIINSCHHASEDEYEAGHLGLKSFNEKLFAEGKVNIVEKSLRRSQEDYSTIFAEPEENNCFSIIAQVIIRANAFYCFLFSRNIKNHAVAILKNSASVLKSPRAG